MNLKRQQIMQAAFTLFYQYGFHAVGINEIIKQANVAKKTLYNHFQSKDDLIIATLEMHHQQLLEHIQQHLELAVPGKDSILIIFELIESWLSGKIDTLPKFHGCYFNRAHAEFALINQDISSVCEAHKVTIHEIFQQHVNDFEEDADKNKLLVDLLVLLKEGVLANNQVFSEENSAQQCIRYIEILLRFKR